MLDWSGEGVSNNSEREGLNMPLATSCNLHAAFPFKWDSPLQVIGCPHPIQARTKDMEAKVKNLRQPHCPVVIWSPVVQLSNNLTRAHLLLRLPSDVVSIHNAHPLVIISNGTSGVSNIQQSTLYRSVGLSIHNAHLSNANILRVINPLTYVTRIYPLLYPQAYVSLW